MVPVAPLVYGWLLKPKVGENTFKDPPATPRDSNARSWSILPSCTMASVQCRQSPVSIFICISILSKVKLHSKA